MADLRRHVGFLEADFKAGDDVTAYIFAEIKKRHPEWKADELAVLEMAAPSSNGEISFTMDGFQWKIVEGGTWSCNNALIRGLIIDQDVTGLRMAFRYDE